jgi:hypothetical protein
MEHGLYSIGEEKQMEYVNCVVDELGTPMYRMSYLEQKGCLEEVLNNHPEWRVVCLLINGEE